MRTYIVAFHTGVMTKANLYRLMNEDHFNEMATKMRFIKVMKFEKSYVLRILEKSYDLGEISLLGKKDLPWISEMFLAAFSGVVQYSLETDGFFNEEKLQKAAKLFTVSILC